MWVRYLKMGYEYRCSHAQTILIRKMTIEQWIERDTTFSDKPMMTYAIVSAAAAAAAAYVRGIVSICIFSKDMRHDCARAMYSRFLLGGSGEKVHFDSTWAIFPGFQLPSASCRIQ